MAGDTNRYGMLEGCYAVGCHVSVLTRLLLRVPLVAARRPHPLAPSPSHSLVLKKQHACAFRVTGPVVGAFGAEAVANLGYLNFPDFL